MVAVRSSDDSPDGYLDQPEPAFAPAAQRSEIEVAADAVMALFEVGILELRDATMVARVAKHTGIPVPDLKAAHERHLRNRAILPRSVLAEEVQAPAVRTGRHVGRPGQGRPSHFTPRQPGEPEFRRCPKCDEELPIEEFLASWRQSKATGQAMIKRHSYCHDHRKAYQRERYLTVDERNELEMVLLRKDGLIGQVCPGCDEKFEPGDLVKSKLGATRHVDCRH